eukprot:TRINITY_DN15042_c0_g1_i1.p1 TRINITY_DN15042_c0_g1~~TRINITY_DN15042_c0_g1_i1.p1  ORF type:complete len:514 (+),score=117.50 TRINITY_DN15042_c0_g1_i1:121-1662(+)
MHEDDGNSLGGATEDAEHKDDVPLLQHWLQRFTTEPWGLVVILCIFLVLRRLLNGPFTVIAAESDDCRDAADEVFDGFDLTDNAARYELMDSDIAETTGCGEDLGMDHGDPMDKARLDLLLRCMSALETRKEDQEPTPQQRKLQRKLLQRAAGIASKKEAPAAEVVEFEKPPEQYSEELEELIKELDDPKQRRGAVGKGSSRSQPKRAAAGKRKGAAGVNSRQSAKQAPKALAETDAKEEPSESGQEGAETATSNSIALPRVPGTLLEAEAEEDVPELTDFQVVGKRRTRRFGLAKTQAVEQVPERTAPPADSPMHSPSHTPIVFGSLLPDDFEIDPEDMNPPGSPLNESLPPVCATNEIFETTPPASDQHGDWEWQCPDGHRLDPYIIPAGTKSMQCSSCRQRQHPGTSVLRSSITGWLACEDCIRLASELPLESQEAAQEPPLKKNEGCTAGNSGNKSSSCNSAASTGLDPRRMSALQIAEWFKRQGAEDALRQCMQQVVAESQVRETVDE